MTMELVLPKVPWAVYNRGTKKYLLADSGNIFKTDDYQVASDVIAQLKNDGADVSNLAIKEYIPEETD